MNASAVTANVLRAVVCIGIVVCAAGLLTGSDDVLTAGILVLICSPMAGAFVTFGCLVKERDWFWAKVCAALIAVLALSVAVAMLV